VRIALNGLLDTRICHVVIPANCAERLPATLRAAILTNRSHSAIATPLCSTVPSRKIPAGVTLNLALRKRSPTPHFAQLKNSYVSTQSPSSSIELNSTSTPSTAEQHCASTTPLQPSIFFGQNAPTQRQLNSNFTSAPSAALAQLSSTQSASEASARASKANPTATATATATSVSLFLSFFLLCLLIYQAL
jgi:hypothetical protein